MSAVSKKLIPASTAFWMIGRLASSSSIQSAMPPKLMQPRQSRDTWVPVDPMRTNFIIHSPKFENPMAVFWRRHAARDRVRRDQIGGADARTGLALGGVARQLAQGPSGPTL